MALITVVTDDFTGAAGDFLTSRTNWDSAYNSNSAAMDWSLTGSGGVVNDIGPSLDVGCETGGTYDDDHWAEVTIGSITAGNEVGPAVRCGTISSDGPDGRCYTAIVDTSGNYTIWRAGTSTATVIASGASSEGAAGAGTVLRLEAVGTGLELFQDGVSIATVTDSNWTTGTPGMLVRGPSSVADAWSGGNFGTLNIRVGANTVSRVYVGATEATRVYHGETIIHDR